MKQILILIVMILGHSIVAQNTSKYATSKKSTSSTTKAVVPQTKPAKIKKSVALLIPYKDDKGKFGYITQHRDIHIKAEYDNVGFFTEDCHLLHSKNEKARKFGSHEYASVRKGDTDYRIDIFGKKVYQYSDNDLALCLPQYKKQRYNAFIQNGFYGIIEASSYQAHLQNFIIYPQYQYLYILESDDVDNPMIIASHHNYFGIIDINGNTIIPFEYADIKRNFSWKLAQLFEVTKDGKNYYYIDADHQSY